jgi:hypothetical protein
MLEPTSMALIWSSDFVDALAGLAVAAAILLIAVLSYVRGRRNSVLEQILVQSAFGSPEAFHGSLEVEKHVPGTFLRLRNSSAAARRLQFKYRWLVGSGRQAWFDEVTFDRSRGIVELRRKTKQRSIGFLECSAVRMQEVGGGRDLRSLWHVELIPRRGRAMPFVTSERGERSTTFEQTAPLAKAVAAIMEVPVHVYLAGNVWTAGWPPKVASPKTPTS